MLARRLLLSQGSSPSLGDPPGQAALSRAGYFVPLGPGLVGGTSLLERSLERLAVGLSLGLDLPRADLPASDGQALMKLLFHAGRSGQVPRPEP